MIVTLEGVVTESELLLGQKEMHAEPTFRGEYPRLINGTEVTKMEVTAEAIRKLARNAVDGGMRRVALVAETDVMYALMRMYEGWASGAECFVSKDPQIALQWLTRKHIG